MSVDLILVIGAIAIVAGIVKGVAVLGFGLVATPLLMLILEPLEVVVALVLPVLFMDALLWTKADAPADTKHLDLPLILGGTVGAVLGSFAVATLDHRPLAALLGAAVAIVAVATFRTSAEPPAPLAREAVPVVSSGVGLVAGLTGFFGPPIMSYLQHLRLSKEILVRTAAMTFIVLGLVRVSAMTAMGLIGVRHLILAAALLLPGLGGLQIGSMLRSRLPERQFANMIRLVIIVSGTWIACDNTLRLLN